MKVAGFTIGSIIISAGMFFCQVAALPENDYMVNLGVQYFQQGQYQDAANILAIASNERPRDPYVHYMRANALSRLKQNAEAAAEYKLSMSLDPSGKIGRYSQQALANLMPPPKTKPKPKPVSDATAAEADETTRQKLTAECDAIIEKINKEAAEKRSALEKEKQSRLVTTGQPLDKLTINQAVEKEIGEKMAAVKKEEMDKVAAASALYARKLSALKRP